MLQPQARQQFQASPPSPPSALSTPQFVSKRPQDGSGRAQGPFSGLVLCVTGLTKEARKQVQQATEKMGGVYSPDLHLHCTHLVVQICAGRKFEHAVKHGLRRGLFVVTLAWFVNCARQHARLDEQDYRVEGTQVDAGVRPEDFARAVMTVPVPSERFCLPPGFFSINTHNFGRRQRQREQQQLQEQQQGVFFGICFFVDADVQPDVRKKVLEAARAGDAMVVESWFLGCSATHVVCEGECVLRYVGFRTHVVSPTWVLMTAKEKQHQRCVQFSVDVSRQLACLLNNERTKLAICGPLDEKKGMVLLRQRQDEIAVAKADVRRRRTSKLQAFRTNVQPVTPSTLLDAVCWSVTELPGTATMLISGAGLLEDGVETPVSQQLSLYFEPHDRGRSRESSTGSQGSEMFTRPMSETDKWEVVYSAPFLTILFPIDQFGEMGPTSMTFVSERGFTCQDILEFISTFYQEYLTPEEVQIAIHTDSKLADQLRSSYASKESIEAGYTSMRRSHFLGMRKNFEGLKRMSKEPSGHVYELVIGG